MHRSIELVETARSIIARLHLVPLNNRLLDAAATKLPPELRTLDAIHLAAAMTAPDLRAIVTYDRQLADAAATAGLAVVAPR
jgi:predicted nucleic acid-binding protein